MLRQKNDKSVSSRYFKNIVVSIVSLEKSKSERLTLLMHPQLNSDYHRFKTATNAGHFHHIHNIATAQSKPRPLTVGHNSTTAVTDLKYGPTPGVLFNRYTNLLVRFHFIRYMKQLYEKTIS
jgi:hypothetical protein